MPTSKLLYIFCISVASLSILKWNALNRSLPPCEMWSRTRSATARTAGLNSNPWATRSTVGRALQHSWECGGADLGGSCSTVCRALQYRQPILHSV